MVIQERYSAKHKRQIIKRHNDAYNAGFAAAGHIVDWLGWIDNPEYNYSFDDREAAFWLGFFAAGNRHHSPYEWSAAIRRFEALFCKSSYISAEPGHKGLWIDRRANDIRIYQNTDKPDYIVEHRYSGILSRHKSLCAAYTAAVCNIKGA